MKSFQAYALLLLLPLVALKSAAANTSLLWGDYGDLHSSTSRLPDFSFAGYHSGERPIPDVAIVTNAADYGATGDGVTDDTQALKDAISATNNGALLIPAGRYKISSRINISKSNIVIRGAGEGQTIIYMPDSISTLEGLSRLPYDGAFFQIRGSPSSPELVGNLSTDASRGDFSVTLDRIPSVSVGQSIILRSDNSNSLGLQLLDGQTVGSDTPGDLSYYTNTLAKVTAVNGNTLTFDRPLRLDARPEWDSQIITYIPGITEFGIEDLTFEMGGTAKRPHNQEEGFNAIDFSGAQHSWVRRVTFIDADNCLLVKFSRFCEFSDLTFIAFQRTSTVTGHHALWVKGYGQGNLFTRFDIQTEFVHELSVEGNAHGNVFSDGFAATLRLDHHANLPYENLFTDLRTSNIGSLYSSGGASARKPHTAARSTIWNITSSGGSAPTIPDWPLFNVIGVSGYSASTSGSGTWVEPLANLVPRNLHLEQQRKRLGLGRSPLANNDSVTTDEDTGVAVTLVATDGDLDPLTYTVETQPTNGVLSGTVPNLTYTPNPGYSGSDSFTFKANDGTFDSNIATVAVTVSEALRANASATPMAGTPPLAVDFTGSATGGLTAVLDDDFSTDTSTDYVWSGTGTSHTWDSTNSTMNVRTGDNRTRRLTRSLDLKSSGYGRIEMIKREDYPNDNFQTIILSQDADNAYLFKVVGSNYSDQNLQKKVGGSIVDEWSETGTIDAEDVLITLEIWWSPNSMRLSIDGVERQNLTTSDTTPIIPTELSFDNDQIDVDLVSILVSDSEADGNYTYAWDFGDGVGTSTEPSPSYTYNSAGSYTAVLTVADGINTATDDESITVNAPLPEKYATWAGGTFTNAFADTGLAANPDGDEMSNFVEFAFGTDPTVQDSASLAIDGSAHGLPILKDAGGGAFDFYFVRRKDHGTSGSVSYTVQFSTDLGSFTDNNNSTNPLINVTDSSVDTSNYEVMRVPYPAASRFGRLEINIAP